MLGLHHSRILERLGLDVSKSTKKGAPRKCIVISDRLSDVLREPCKSGNSVTRASLLVEIRILKEAIDDLHDDTSRNVVVFKRIV